MFVFICLDNVAVTTVSSQQQHHRSFSLGPTFQEVPKNIYFRVFFHSLWGGPGGNPSGQKLVLGKRDLGRQMTSSLSKAATKELCDWTTGVMFIEITGCFQDRIGFPI